MKFCRQGCLFWWRKDDSDCSKYSVSPANYPALPLYLYHPKDVAQHTETQWGVLVCVFRYGWLAEYGYDGMLQCCQDWLHDNHQVSCLTDRLCIEWVSEDWDIQDIYCLPWIPASFDTLSICQSYQLRWPCQCKFLEESGSIEQAGQEGIPAVLAAQDEEMASGLSSGSAGCRCKGSGGGGYGVACCWPMLGKGGMGLAVSGMQNKEQCHFWTIKELAALNPAFEQLARISIDFRIKFSISVLVILAEFSIDFRMKFSTTLSVMNSDPQIH